MKYCLPLIMLLLIACKQENKTVAPSHIQPKKMEQILYDMQLADVYSSSVVIDSVHRFGNKNIDSLARYYQEILKHHGTSYEDFNKTIAWYKENPITLDSVYTKVLNRISTEGEKLGVH